MCEYVCLNVHVCSHLYDMCVCAHVIIHTCSLASSPVLFPHVGHAAGRSTGLTASLMYIAVHVCSHLYNMCTCVLMSLYIRTYVCMCVYNKMQYFQLLNLFWLLRTHRFRIGCPTSVQSVSRRIPTWKQTGYLIP